MLPIVKKHTKYFILGRKECEDYKTLSFERDISILHVRPHFCDHLSHYYKNGITYESYEQISWDFQGTSWYRFEDYGNEAILAQTSPGGNNCAASGTGWSNASLPETAGDSFHIPVCFDEVNDDDEVTICSYQTKAKVTNCGDYFVYFLYDTQRCPYRYCTQIVE